MTSNSAIGATELNGATGKTGAAGGNGGNGGNARGGGIYLAGGSLTLNNSWVIANSAVGRFGGNGGNGGNAAPEAFGQERRAWREWGQRWPGATADLPQVAGSARRAGPRRGASQRS